VINSLAYIGIVSPAAEEWRSFGPEVLGAELAADGPDGAVRLRVDEAAWRIAIHPGEANDLAYLGWLVDDLDGTVKGLEAAGQSVDRGEGGSFTDPFGFRHCLTTHLETGASFTPGRPISGFVTGDQGLGHAVLIVPDLQAALAYFTEVLGLRLSDSIGPGLRFLHCPGRAARHHSVALAGLPGMVGLHHLMLEVASLDDVGSGHDIVVERQLPLAMSLGRHPNDLMTSFYVRSPSGFEIEYGTGGRTVDDADWEVGSYEVMSLWGHKPPAPPLLPGILRPYQPTGASA
jgi:3,4-dihydroxy-9,10-secoandrosta-1,3,5(10)-triene-9,17-dione 4,5-dioxygenase